MRARRAAHAAIVLRFVSSIAFASRLVGKVDAVGVLAAAVALGACWPFPATAAPRQATIDRIAAVVNREVITVGQLERAVRRVEESGDEDPTASCTPPAGGSSSLRARVLQCMIDDLLQFQHVRRFPQFDVPEEDIEEAFAELAARYESADAFQQALQQQQRTPEEVRYDLEREALIASYINARYRAIVDVSESARRRYYEEVLRPEMEQQREPLPTFAAVDAQIERLLVETEVNRRVDEWIADLRRRASIVVYTW